eukprot:312921_1
MNNKNSLAIHPADIAESAEQNGEPDREMFEPQQISNNEFDYCHEIMTPEEWKSESKLYSVNHSPANHVYIHKQKSKKYAQGQKYDAMAALKRIKPKVIVVNNKIEHAKRKMFTKEN